MPKIGYGYALYTGNPSVIPSSDLILWLKADSGVATSGNGEFISQVVISGAITSSIDGTYVRTTGGHTGFTKVGGGTGITWNNSNVSWDIGNIANASPISSWYNTATNEFEATATLTTSNYTENGVDAWNSQVLNYQLGKPYLKPSYISSSINGRPAIRFSEISQPFSSDSLETSGIIASESNTIFIVTKYGDTDFGTIIGFGNEALVIHKSGNTISAGSDYNGVFATTNSGPNSNTPCLICVSVGGENITANIYINGVLVASNDVYFASSATTFTTGNTGTTAQDANRGFVGEISEVIGYGRPLTTQERQQVEGYLNAKYAIY